MQRKKLTGVCAQYLKGLHEFAKTGDDFYLHKAISRMRGFISHYGRIPDIAAKETRQLARWAERKRESMIGQQKRLSHGLLHKR